MNILNMSKLNAASVPRRSSPVLRVPAMALVVTLLAGASAANAFDGPGEQSERTEAGARSGTASPAVRRFVISAGGGRSGGGVYGIHGTVGQPDAEPLQPSSGEPFSITGGFWPGLASTRGWFLFEDGFEGRGD